MTKILLISGSNRSGSTNTAVLRTVVELCRGTHISAELYDDTGSLPSFCPDDDRHPLPLPVAALRAEIAASDALMVCVPEYASGLPGSFKNLLDWTVGGMEMDQKPVGWMNLSSTASRNGGQDAHDSLAKAFWYLNADVVTDACARIPMSRGDVTMRGDVIDICLRQRIAQTVEALADRVTKLSEARRATTGVSCSW